MSTKLAKPEHEVVYQDLAALLRKHADEVTALEVLAIAANMVGKLIALQDQRVTTPDVAMGIVIKNLELGNQQVLAQVLASKGNA